MADRYQRDTQVVDLDEVLAFWAKEYKLKDETATVISVDSYVDASKGKAIFIINSVRSVADEAE